MRTTNPWLMLFAAWQACSLAALGDDASDLVRHAESFQQARGAGDWETLRRLVHSDASSLDAKGRELRRLRKDLQSESKRIQEDPASDQRLLRIVQRDVVLHGDAAIVTEMIRAVMRVGEHRVVPLRRTLVWIRSDHNWMLAHLHASPYARWEPSITAFEAQDEASSPLPGGVVFLGSSSIRRWKTLADDFPQVVTIGRGFGGSQLIDSVLYAHRIVTPYKPAAVAVYAGDNDIAAGKLPEDVLRDFQMLVDTIHADLPSARVAFIAIKPSLKRWDMWPQMKRANHLVEGFARDQELVDYLDIATPMIGADGDPKPELFVDDGLHLTEPGYLLWTSVISPWVDRLAESTP